MVGVLESGFARPLIRVRERGGLTLRPVSLDLTKILSAAHENDLPRDIACVG